MAVSKRLIYLLAGPAGAFFTYQYVLGSSGDPTAARMAGIAVWMAVWWITEAVSIYVTSLIPLLLFPFMGIMPMKETTPHYTNEIIFLFVGGFILSLAMEKWNLHRRIALRIVMITGNTPSRVMFGLMFASWFLSMWMSNTATAMMMLPAVMAIASGFEASSGESGAVYARGLLLGMAYACSIGGTATLVGTPPNIIFAGFYRENFGGTEISFTGWMLFGLPVALILLFITFLYLRFRFVKPDLKIASLTWIHDEYRALGKLRQAESTLLVVFATVIFLWLFRADIDFGNFTIRGWSNLFEAGFITDSTVAMLGALSLFLLPSGRKGTIMKWDDVKKIPLGVLFLFGGGFALAAGIAESGLADWLAFKLSVFTDVHPLMLILVLAAFMSFFTELTSNSASTYLVLSILLGFSGVIEYDPLLIMIPVVFSASFAFMLPVATPPNTIVFGSEKLSIRTMVTTGFVLNIIGILLITLATWFLAPLIFF